MAWRSKTESVGQKTTSGLVNERHLRGEGSNCTATQLVDHRSVLRFVPKAKDRARCDLDLVPRLFTEVGVGGDPRRGAIGDHQKVVGTHFAQTLVQLW